MGQEEAIEDKFAKNIELNCEQESNENKDQFDDLKMHLRKIPCKSSNIETKIRETELLSSFFKDSSNQTIEPKEDKKAQTKVQEKTKKSLMTIATLNENVQKQTYKIRFKVNLTSNSSKSSVLQYLFGCFGGEKLFHKRK